MSREAVEMVVVPGRMELPVRVGVAYWGFVDPSGGSSDSMTLAIGHCEKRGGSLVGILDVVRERRAPFSPEEVVKEFADVLKGYRVSSVVGDRFAGEFAREPFRKRGISYKLSDRPKSDLFRDLLSLVNSRRTELLDNARLVAQLCALERRTSRAGKDSIDHPPNAHDDLANACAGALVACEAPATRAGLGWGIADDDEEYHGDGIKLAAGERVVDEGAYVYTVEGRTVDGVRYLQRRTYGADPE